MKLLISIALVLVMGCGKKDDASKPADKSAPAAPAAGTTGGGDVGIPECDDYVAKMTACLPKLEPPLADQVKKQLDLQAPGWKAAKGQPGIADNCKRNLETAKQQYESKGCSF